MSTETLPASAIAPKKLPRHSLLRIVLPLLRLLRTGNLDGIVKALDRAEDVFYMRSPFGRFVVLNDPARVEEVLVTNHKDYHKDPGYAALKRLMGEGLITSEDDFHLRQRRMIQPAFHKKRIDDYADCMVRYSREQTAHWKDGETRDVSVEMMAVTLKIISKTMFDADVAGDVEAVYDAINLVTKYAARYFSPTVGRIFDVLPLSSTRKLKGAETVLNNIIHRFIREHREAEEDKGDLLSMLLLARGEDGAERMSDQQLRDECITLFVAGHETTSIAMTWTWYLLAKHPEIEAKLHEELARVLEGGRDATADDVPKLTYTRQVFAESMRLLPPVYAVGRQAIRDSVVGGFEIRNRDLVIVPNYVLQNSARWFPEPERFDPDRWLPERAAKIPKFAYFPFGGGMRKCIGEPFVWMEGILLLATFAQQWKFALTPETRFGLRHGVTVRPKYGMQMTLHRR